MPKAQHSPPDPEPDWGKGSEKNVRLYRIMLLGHIWSIIATAIGVLFLLWLLLIKD